MPVRTMPLLANLLFAACAACAFASPESDGHAWDADAILPVAARLPIDHSGRPRRGLASYYATRLHGRKTADGSRMNLNSNMAASRTLPFGTTARVTNLRNGRCAVVQIRDRGPYVKGRIIDVTPRVADRLGFRREGVTPVVVKPLRRTQKKGQKKPPRKRGAAGLVRGGDKVTRTGYSFTQSTK
jgi:rare lipoprotein A